MKEAAGELPEDEGRGDTIKIELPLDTSVLRREPHAPHVNAARPHRPGERVLEVHRRALRVDQLAKEGRPEQRLRGDAIQRP